MSPQFTVTQTKAEIQSSSITASPAAGTSLSIDANVMVYGASVENVAVSQIQFLERDGSTWTEVDDPSGTLQRPAAADDPSVYVTNFATNATHVRIRNTSAGAIQMKFLYWELV